MKTIYKIMIAFLAISMMIGIASADHAEMRTLEPAEEPAEVYIPSINPHNIPIYNIPSYIPVQISYMNGQC